MLNQSITLGEVLIKNRTVAAPIVSDSGDVHGLPTARSMEIYQGYASCGAGLVVAEQHAVHPWGRNRVNQFRLYTDASAAALEPLTNLFHINGVPVVAQLNFAGAGASGKALLDETDFCLVSPSGLRTPRDPLRIDPSPLGKGEIHEIIQSFANAAQRAITLAGYSGGVQIYACHGYLISQFLSPLTNQRGDNYGGSLAGRAKLLFEIVEGVRAAIGNFPLSVRLGAADTLPGAPQEGLVLADSVWIARKLADMGVHWIGVSGNHCSYGIGVDDSDTAYFAPYAKAIRDVVKQRGIYVDCTGGIRTRTTAEILLRTQVCDFVGVGRPLINNKDFLSGWKC